MCVRIHLCVSMHVLLCVHECVCMQRVCLFFVCNYVYIFVSVIYIVYRGVCVCVNVHVCAWGCVSVYSICIRVDVCVYMCVCACSICMNVYGCVLR